MLPKDRLSGNCEEWRTKMAIMNIRELRKTYLTHERGSSFLDSLKSLVKRKIIRVEAIPLSLWSLTTKYIARLHSILMQRAS